MSYFYSDATKEAADFLSKFKSRLSSQDRIVFTSGMSEEAYMILSGLLEELIYDLRNDYHDDY